MSSDSDLASVVEALQFGNYVSLAVATAVTYDFIITFSNEINYIWNRPWTLVTMMFIVVRYIGLFVAVIEGLYGSAFIPGPTLVGFPSYPSTMLFIASDYAFNVFLAAADIVMILRVFAMYNKSRVVLGLLLVLYTATIVLYFISSAHYDNPKTVLSVTNPQVLDMSFCNPVLNTSSNIGKYKLIPRLALAALMFALAVLRLCLDSFQAYRETKRWEANRYINLLVREGVLYFFAHLFNTIDFGHNMPGTIVNAIIFVVMFVLSPRFIMSVRALHLRNILSSDHCNGIDTGFGFSTGQPTSRVSIVSSVGFARSFVFPEENVEMGVIEGDANC